MDATTTIPTAVVKPSDPRVPLAQSTPAKLSVPARKLSTPIADSTRSKKGKKRPLPEPTPSSATSSAPEPDKKKTKQVPSKPSSSKNKASTTLTKAKKLQKTSSKEQPVSDASTISSKTTTTTTTTTKEPSTSKVPDVAGDVNKTVSSDSVLDVKMASTGGSTTDDDAYDDGVTKSYINLKQRYSKEYAASGLKSTPSGSGDSGKNLHQVIKSNKRKRKMREPPSPSYLPFNSDDSKSSGDSSDVGKVAIGGPIVHKSPDRVTKRIAKKVEKPVEKKTVDKTDKPVEKKVVKKVDMVDKVRVEKKVSSVVTVPRTSTIKANVTDASTSKRPLSKSKSPPERSPYIPSSSKTPSGSSSGSGSTSGTSTSAPCRSSFPAINTGQRRTAIRFSARDGTLKLNSNGYQTLDIRQDPNPVLTRGSNRSHHHQK